MSRREHLLNCVAGVTALFVILHAALGVLEMNEDVSRMVPRILLLTGYAACLVILDYLMLVVKSRTAARLFSRYWLAATAWMAVWCVWGEQWLCSSNDIFKLLLTLILVPYAPMPLWGYEGWPWGRQAHPGITLALLALCGAHLVFYMYLRYRKTEE